jgi:hypothetical protein
MIKGGYYIKARKIQESEIAHAAPSVREIWDWLLREANHKDNKGIARGSMVRTYRDIQEGLSWYCGWRKMTYNGYDCENAMKWLTKHTMITTRKTTRGLVINIVNYDLYQNPKNYESHTESYRTTTRLPQTTDTINKNDKNDKNEILPTETVGVDIPVIIESFKEVNPAFKKWFARPPMRDACSRLLALHGKDKLLQVIALLPKTNKMPYFPSIMTPMQLEDKWSSLEAQFIRKKEALEAKDWRKNVIL